MSKVKGDKRRFWMRVQEGQIDPHKNPSGRAGKRERWNSAGNCRCIAGEQDVRYCNLQAWAYCIELDDGWQGWLVSRLSKCLCLATQKQRIATWIATSRKQEPPPGPTKLIDSIGPSRKVTRSCTRSNRESFGSTFTHGLPTPLAAVAQGAVTIYIKHVACIEVVYRRRSAREYTLGSYVLEY